MGYKVRFSDVCRIRTLYVRVRVRAIISCISHLFYIACATFACDPVPTYRPLIRVELMMVELSTKRDWDSLLDSVDTVLLDCDGE